MPSFFGLLVSNLFLYFCYHANLLHTTVLIIAITLVESVGGCNNESFIVVVLGILACGLHLTFCLNLVEFFSETV